MNLEKVEVVKNIFFEVEKGELVALTEHNGAGKILRGVLNATNEDILKHSLCFNYFL